MTAALLTLADSRLPAGGHTHSGGVEQAIAAGVVDDPRTLTAFLRRRLHTAGAVAAGLAAAACGAADETGPGGLLEEVAGGLSAAGERHVAAVGARRATDHRAASSTSMRALSVCSTMTRSEDSRGSTWVVKNRAAASLPS